VRLFVAAEVGSAVVAGAQALIAQLRPRAETLAPGARITWIPAPLMHLTLRFIGNVNDGTAAAIADALRPAVDRGPFTLHFEGAGAFPLHGPPRVLWAGLSAGIDELVTLEVEVSRRLQQLGIPPDDRVFSPHLTLGRVREPAGLSRDTLLAGLERAPVGTGQVDAITLFESRLSPKGPTYVPLQRTPLWKKPSPSSPPTS
jgi:2'-5' RNA ligase